MCKTGDRISSVGVKRRAARSVIKGAVAAVRIEAGAPPCPSLYVKRYVKRGRWRDQQFLYCGRGNSGQLAVLASSKRLNRKKRNENPHFPQAREVGHMVSICEVAEQPSYFELRLAALRLGGTEPFSGRSFSITSDSLCRGRSCAEES